MPHSENIRRLLEAMGSSDAAARRLARAQLIQLGEAAKPTLRRISENGDSVLQRRAARILEILHENDILGEWRRLLDLPEEQIQVEDGAILIARAEFSVLRKEDVLSRIDSIAETLAQRLPLEPAPTAVLEELNRLLFAEMGFKGNEDAYYEPANSFINLVLIRHTGIPISLSVLYMAICRRVGLRLLGVGMPRHFLVKFEAQNEELFVDVFNQGRFLSRDDCRAALAALGVPYQPEYLLPVSAPEIFVRMLRNLIGVYQQRKETLRALRCLNQLLTVRPDSAPELFLRAGLNGEMGEFESAIADIERLQGLPDSSISEAQITQLLSRLISQSN